MFELALYVGVLLALPIFVWRYPPVAITALLSVQVLDFWGQMSSPLVAENPLFTNLYIVGVLLIACIARVLRGGLYRYKVPLQGLLCGLLWGYAFASLLWSPVQALALEEWARYWPYMALSILVSPFIIANVSDLDEVLKSIVVLGGTLTLMVACFVSWDSRYVVAFWSDSVKFWNALAFAQLAGYVVIAAAIGLTARSKWWLMVRIITICAGLIVAVQSGSRGQFILMVLLPVVMVPLAHNLKNWRAYISLVLLSGLVISVAYFAFTQFSGSDDRWSRERFDADLEGRVSMALNLLSSWWAHGEKNIASLILGLGNSASFDPAINGFYPHMVPVEILAEEGIIGFTLFITINLIFGRHLFKIITADYGSRTGRSCLVAIGTMYLFAFMLSFKQGSLLNMTPEMFLFLFLLERAMQSAQTRVPNGHAPSINVSRYANIIN